MAERSNRRLGQRNPLQLFNDSQKESVAPDPSDEAPQEDSGITKTDSLIKIHETGKNNQESGIRKKDSGASKQESEDIATAKAVKSLCFAQLPLHPSDS